MKLMSARGAQQTRDRSSKLNSYSKCWLPGDTLRVFYPIYWENGNPELAVGAVWGHNVNDMKACGIKTPFIVSSTEFDDNKKPIGQPDIAYQFSCIAPIFIRGMKAVEEAKIAEKKFPTEASRREALNALDAKYDTKNNANAVKSVISPPVYYIATEVLCVKWGNNGPDMKSVQHVAAPLSRKVINNIYQIMDKPQFRPEEGAEFIEIEWSYPVNTDKGQSGRDASPAGVTQEYKMQTQYPTEYDTLAYSFSSVSHDSETIIRRATRSIDMNEIRNALTQYSVVNSEFLDVASAEDVERLERNWSVVKELDIVGCLTNESLINTFKRKFAEVEELEKIAPEPAPAPEPEPEEPPKEEVTPEPGAAPNVAPSLDSLLNNPNMVDLPDLDLVGA